MAVFWVSISLVILTGFSLFAPLLLRPGRPLSPRRSDVDILLDRDIRTELAREGADLSVEDRAALGEDLDRRLLHDLSNRETPLGKTGDQRGRGALALSLSLALLLGSVFYLEFGRPDLIGRLPESLRTTPSVDVHEAIRRLSERLAENPSDLQGWLLLARSLQATAQMDKAVTAYEFALKLAPADLDIRALYAQALAEASRSFQGRPSEILAEILASNPKHENSLWLSGLAAVERGEPEVALNQWRTLRAQLADGSESAEQLDRYLAELRGSETTESEAPGSRPRGGTSVHLRVTLAKALESKAAPDDIVFISAKAADGPPMPLAVLRKRVRDLPIEVTLDDSMAMAPGFRLSNFDQIVITARVSKSGSPETSAGDFIGKAGPLQGTPAIPYPVEINEIVP